MASMAVRSGLTSEVPLPFSGVVLPGTLPFTVFPLAEELARLGFETSQLGCSGKLVNCSEQLEDSGLGLEGMGPLEGEEVQQQQQPRLEVSVRGPEGVLPDLPGGQGEVVEGAEQPQPQEGGLGPEEAQQPQQQGQPEQQPKNVHCRLTLQDDEEGGGGTVGQRGPAPTPHQHARGWAKPGQQGPEGQQQAGAGGGAGGGPSPPPRDTCTPHQEAHQPGEAEAAEKLRQAKVKALGWDLAMWRKTAAMLTRSTGKMSQVSMASKQHGGAFLDRVWDTVDEAPRMPWQTAGVELQEITRLGREFLEDFGELEEGQGLEFLPLVKEISKHVRQSCPWPELLEAEKEGMEDLDRQALHH